MDHKEAVVCLGNSVTDWECLMLGVIYLLVIVGGDKETVCFGIGEGICNAVVVLPCVIERTEGEELVSVSTLVFMVIEVDWELVFVNISVGKVHETVELPGEAVCFD